MTKKQICFATNNAHKIQEVRAILGEQYQILSLQEIGCHEELSETMGTIVGNSRQKAEYVSSKYKIDCFADDSGLLVDALNGEPGVDSAFYAGEPRSFERNIQKLLSNLEGKDNRNAKFVTVISLVQNGNLLQFEGQIEGQILTSPKGTNGFGYDPVFLPKGQTKVFAEMTAEEKNSLSHRSKAVKKLENYLKSNILASTPDGTIIRWSTPDDVPQAHALICELALYEKAPEEVINTPEKMLREGFGENPVYKMIVAENNEGKIVGISIFFFSYSTWKGKSVYLDDIVVTESYRGKGIGKLLFEQVIRYAKATEAGKMHWQVLDWNEPAINFYKKFDTNFEGGWLNSKLTDIQLQAFDNEVER